MIKVLLRRFQQCLATLAMLLLEGSSPTGLLAIHLTTLSESIISRILNIWRSSFFSKWSQFNLHFENTGINSEKVFCLQGNCIWLGIVKLSLLRTGYFSSAANALRSSAKVLHVNKRDFFQINWPGSDQIIWWRCYDAHLNSALARLLCCLSKGLLQPGFLDIYLTTFSEAITSEIINLWGSSFFF